MMRPRQRSIITCGHFLTRTARRKISVLRAVPAFPRYTGRSAPATIPRFQEEVFFSHELIADGVFKTHAEGPEDGLSQPVVDNGAQAAGFQDALGLTGVFLVHAEGGETLAFRPAGGGRGAARGAAREQGLVCGEKIGKRQNRKQGQQKEQKQTLKRMTALIARKDEQRETTRSDLTLLHSLLECYKEGART
jgi:hypothetical protein